MKLFSPAKINLFLRILKKRSDGYHQLASLFQAIDIGDTIEFHLSDEDSLTASDPNLRCDRSNLISKALDLFRRKTGLKSAIRIHLEKRIPMEAGLGGGSGNAATTLWALNHLHGLPVSIDELQKWSSEIGSDVPFFFSEGTAFCTGRGEEVNPLPSPPILPPLALYKPREGLSTPAVYQALNLNKCAPISPEKLIEEFYNGEPFFHNDLEAAAFHALPNLVHYKQQLLSQGWKQVTLSGSGTSFFGLGRSEIPIKCIQRESLSWYACPNHDDKGTHDGKLRETALGGADT